MANRSDLSGFALSYFGVVQKAASERLGTAAVWEQVKSEAARRGEPLPANMFQAVNTLRAYASSLRNAAEAFRAAEPGNAITSDYVAPLPYGHNPSTTGGMREFHVRVGFTATDMGGEQQRYVTLVYPGSLPPTVAELQSEAQTLAAVAAIGYESAFGEVTAIEIGEV
jgi:hypothetical protein